MPELYLIILSVIDVIVILLKMLKYLQRTVVTNPNADLDTRRDIVGPLLDDLVCRVTEKSVSNGAGLNTVNRKYKADWEKKYEWLMFERGRS